MRIIFIFLTGFFAFDAHAQINVSGSVLDKTKINFVEGARVITTAGKMAFTDSMGRYSISTGINDSIFFIYNNKPTQKFAANKITDPTKFDISLLISVKSKYTILKEVLVYSKSYKEDSAETRDTYKNIFSYRKPGLSMDVDELINIFRFRRNKRLQSFQNKLIADEKERFIDNRFSKVFVRRITQLKGSQLDSFMVWYRPSFDFISRANEVDFNQSILNSLYHYRRITGGEAKKEEDLGR